MVCQRHSISPHSCLSCSIQDVANTDALKREVFHIQRELVRERMRCKALEEELETPMNIHRWRKLEGRCVCVLEDVIKCSIHD